jgi:hypothetical protein
MKKLLICLALAISSATTFGAVTVRYENMDDKGYTMWVRIDGTEKEVHFDIATSSLVIQGGNNVCTIETRCGNVEVRDGDKVYIRDGCIKVTRK